MSDTQIRDDQDQVEDQDQESQGDQDESQEDAGSSKITFNAKTLTELQNALKNLTEFPKHAPQNFDVIYVELEGKVGDQLVTAQYEENEWSLTLDGQASSDEEDKGESEESSQEEEYQPA